MASGPSSANQFAKPNLLPPPYVQKRKADPDQPGAIKKPCVEATALKSDVNEFPAAGSRDDCPENTGQSLDNRMDRSYSELVKILSSSIDRLNFVNFLIIQLFILGFF